jgi:hypothetical protein
MDYAADHSAPHEQKQRAILAGTSPSESSRGDLERMARRRFQDPKPQLIKPDVRISRIRLSDWLHRRLTNEAASRLVPRDGTRGRSFFALRYSLI